MEIKSLNCVEVRYPMFSNPIPTYFSYLEKVIVEILQLTKKDDIITFISRGTSGAICTGYMMSGLYNEGYTNIKVCLSRKHVTHHDYPYQWPEGIVIFVDDIIESGETLASAIEDFGHIDYAFVSTSQISMEEYISKRNFDMISKNIDYLYLG